MSIFVLNNKIELSDQEGNKIFGLIYDFLDDKLYVSTTSDEKNLRILHLDDQVRGLTFSGLKGIAFDGIVTKRISGDLLIYEISSIKNIRLVQRREDVRVPCSMAVYFTDNPIALELDNSILDDKIEDLKEISEKAISSDLSAGGMKFSTMNKLETNKEIILLFYINKKPIIVKGKILHKTSNIVKKRSHYSYGIKFIDIKEAQREIIISHLFVLMRKNRIR